MNIIYVYDETTKLGDFDMGKKSYLSTMNLNEYIENYKTGYVSMEAFVILAPDIVVNIRYRPFITMSLVDDSEFVEEVDVGSCQYYKRYYKVNIHTFLDNINLYLNDSNFDYIRREYNPDILMGKSKCNSIVSGSYSIDLYNGSIDLYKDDQPCIPSRSDITVYLTMMYRSKAAFQIKEDILSSILNAYYTQDFNAYIMYNDERDGIISHKVELTSNTLNNLIIELRNHRYIYGKVLFSNYIDPILILE